MIGIVLRGVLMGLAEVVPGISGGTIAFVTGIYSQLVQGLASFGLRSVPMLMQWQQFRQHHQLDFLIPLAVGMAIGVMAFAQLMSYLLAHFQPLVWSFFSGLILMSVYSIGREQDVRHLLRFAPLGLLAGLALLLLPSAQAEPSYLVVFAGGAIAVCAWLLPAVSGSFILLTLGLYSAVITAVAELQLDILFSLALGCATGILFFTKALSWLLLRAESAVFSFFTGFMAGALVNLWPWQNGGGDLLTPAQYLAEMNSTPMVHVSLACFVVGMVAMYGLSGLVQQDKSGATNPD